jgi:hypothetical protein
MRVREEVRRFAQMMELKLKANDHKGGWQNCSPLFLLGRLKEETAELEQEIRKWFLADKEQIIKEAVDVANFAMMIADLARREKPQSVIVEENDGYCN